VKLTIQYKFGNDVRLWTVTAKAAGPPMLATARHRSLGEGRAIASGAIEDVGTGDAAFDRAWLVEGAPKQTIRSVFDEDVRRAMDAVGDFTLAIEDGKIVASVNGSGVSGLDAIQGGIAAVLALRKSAARIGSGSKEERAEAEAAIAALRAKRERFWARLSIPGKIGTVFLVTVLVIAVGSGLFYGCGINTLFR
jgi:hypothetical protein